MILCLLLLAAVLFLLIRFGRTDRALLKKEKKKRKVPLIFGGAGLWVCDFLRKMRSKNWSAGAKEDTNGSNPLLYSKEEIRVRTANRYGLMLLTVFIGAIAGLFASIAYYGDRTVTELTRPDFGEDRLVDLNAEMEGESHVVSVRVPYKELSEEALTELFDSLYAELIPKWLNGNESSDRVTVSMDLTEDTGTPVSARFVSSEPEWITGRGTILQDTIPEEGKDVVMTVILSYADVQKSYEWPLKLIPKQKTEDQSIAQAVSEAAGEDRTKETFRLPEEVGGKKIVFSKDAVSPFFIALLSLVGAALVWYVPKEREKEAIKKREAELTLSYSSVVIKLSSLITAGLSIRSAWGRIVSGYRKTQTARKPKKQYAYEEMQRTLNELESGVGESEAYVSFGRRTGVSRYVKLGNLLSENMRQGISGLEKSLKEEAQSALEERKNIALKKGEETGTKLLAPMMIMLGIVIVALVAPALMSF